MRKVLALAALLLAAPLLSCDDVPRTDCTEAAPDGALLLLGNHLKPEFKAARLVWAFTKGQTATDFGDPTATTDYEFCLYDYSEGSPVLRFDFLAPAGPNWTKTAGEFRYSDTQIRDGLNRARLGRHLIVHATSTHAWGLPFASDPFVVVQLIGAGCWSATYDHPKRNERGQYASHSTRTRRALRAAIRRSLVKAWDRRTPRGRLRSHRRAAAEAKVSCPPRRLLPNAVDRGNASQYKAFLATRP